MKRTLVVTTVIVLAALLVSSCGGESQEPEGQGAIKIGLVAEMTGSLPAVGTSCVNGAKLAVEEINKAGGVDVGGARRRLELVLKDCANDPKKCGPAVKELAGKGVLAIVGPNASANAIPAAKQAQAEGVLFITPWSTDPSTTVDAQGNHMKFAYRGCFTDVFEGEVLGNFASDNLKAKKAAILCDGSSKVLVNQAAQFKKSFEVKGGAVVASELFNKGDRKFDEQLGRIKAAGPELIMLPAYYDDVPAAVTAARAAGITVPFLGSDGWMTPDLIKKAGSAVEGSYLCTHYSPESTNVRTKEFVAAYDGKFKKTPDDVAALSYDSVYLVKKALENAGKTQRAAVQQGMAAVRTFEGATGKMSYPEGSGDPLKSAVVMQIKNGAFSFVTEVTPPGI